MKNKILLTGGAGFIGSHLGDVLLSKGSGVIAMDDFSTGTKDNVKHNLDNPDFELIEGDICKEEDLNKIDFANVTYIFHLAAAVGVQLIVDEPLKSLDTNLKGTEIVLKKADELKIPIFVASTSEVYGKSEKFPFTESDDVVLGSTQIDRWSYAAAKMIDEFLGLAYHRKNGTGVTVVRFFNTVGPRQTGFYGMVVPRFIEQALKGEDITVYGDGQQSRCFGHVLDIVDGLVALMETGKGIGQVTNIGNNFEITIEGLAQEVIKKTGSSSKIVKIPYEEAYKGKSFEDMRRRVPNLEKIKSLVGYSPKRTLDNILEDTIKYIKETKGL